jgi:carbon-monoxide dehydrogenase large subunit
VSELIGAPIRRNEDPRLLRGEGRYISDLSIPGMLTAAVVRSVHAHARIVSVDAGCALALPGVVAVFTWRDLGAAQRPIPTFGQIPEALHKAWRPTVRPAPVYPLAQDKARYVGEPIALVVAADRYVAADAVEMVDVTYEPLPVVVDVEQAALPDSPKLFEGWPDNTALHLEVGYGDVDGAFRRAAHRFAGRYGSHRYTGVPLEGRGMLAVPELAGQGMTVWTSQQLPHFHRATICEALGLPEHAVRAVQPDIGGGFGQKAGLYPEDVLIPFAAWRLGRPVKWMEGRVEHFMASSHSREQLHDVEVAVDEDGVLLGLRDRVLIDAGAYLTFPIVLPYLGLCHMLGPYRVPALYADIRSVLTNKVTSAPYRGAGRPEGVFVINRIMDRIAGDLGLDPAEVRRRNFIRPEEMPYSAGILYRDGTPMVLDSGDYPAMLERCLEAVGYGSFRAEQAAARRRGAYVGIGMACNVEATGIGPFEGARVRIDPNGEVAVYAGVTNQGQGHQTVFAQICAAGLGVSPDKVSVTTGDTGNLRFGRGTYHSRGAVTAGNAVYLAAGKVRTKVIRLAANVLEAAPEDLEVSDGWVRVKGSPDRGLSLGKCAQLAIPGGPLPSDLEPGLDETAYFNVPAATWGSAAHAAIVEVDPETGLVKILRYVVVHDCGRVLNPLILDGQIHGGVAAGIGGALLEHLVYDENGQLLTTTFMDYLLPTVAEIPEMEIVHQETPSPLNPLGVKGAGEGGTLAPPAVLAAAVEDALGPLGVRITRTPVSPAAILAAVRATARENTV